MMNSILAAKEERWAKKLSLAKSLAVEGQAGPTSLAVLTLRMPASLRRSDRSPAIALSLHASFAGELRERGISLLHEEFRVSGDGPESYIAAVFDPVELKRLAVDWESCHPWGELADLDVMDSKGNPVGRADLGLPPRACLVCGENASVCTTGRRHEVAVIKLRVDEILRRPEGLGRAEDRKIGRLALAATLLEASALPKPGLVGPFSPGAHRDMDYPMFLSSAAAIGPWFTEFAKLGRLHRGPPSDLLPVLREAGKEAERDMFDATGGVNTHKGLIFSMGLLCAAAGRQAAAGGSLAPSSCADCAAAIARGISAGDFGGLEPAGGSGGPASGRAARPARTTGEMLYLKRGVRGIRGEAEDGFPSVIGHALPRLRADISAGLSMNDAMVDALLVLYTVVEDTNVLGRAGREGLDFLRAEAGHVLELGAMATPPGREAARAMDASVVKRNISPGGCADLLALTVFLETLAAGFPGSKEAASLK